MVAYTRRSASEIGEMIKELRKEKKMSQLSLSMAVHTDQSTISRIESGGSQDVMVMMDICEVFGVTLNDICYAAIEDEREKEAKEAGDIIMEMDNRGRKMVMEMLRAASAV